MAFNNEDLAYAAGIMDGEGCIYISRQNDKRGRPNIIYALYVQVVMGDYEVPKWLQDTFGGWLGIQKKSPAALKICPNNKKLYKWRLTSQRAIEFLVAIRPWVKIKLTQIDLAVELGKTKIPRGTCATPETIETKEHLAISMRNANQRRN